MKKNKRAFTLIELLVVVAIIALLISILLPSLSRARELSKRLVCAANLKGIGTSFKIYANDNEESWPIANFNSNTTTAVINYVDFSDANPLYDNLAFSIGNATSPGRLGISTPTSTQLSTTRSLWILVRSGEVTPKQFICPSSGDQVEAEANIDLYYDFNDYDNISYGYQVPYGPFDTRASESSDPRLAVAADKGPYSRTSPANPGSISGTPSYNVSAPDLGLSPQEWRTWNSGNHGGGGTGEGQNVLFADGHATFNKTPLAGIDNDNIFTNMSPAPANGGFGWLGTGLVPVKTLAGAWYPGRNAFTNSDSSTDSVIYP